MEKIGFFLSGVEIMNAVKLVWVSSACVDRADARVAFIAACLRDDLTAVARACRIEKRSKFSRRRQHDEEENIDYINDRNMKFNKKLERFYGKYTTEIKQNLERGTAI